MNVSPEEDEIRETINYYSEGMKCADAETLKKAFHQQAILCGYIGDEIIAGPIQALYDWVETNSVPDRYKCSVLGIEITGRVAAATIRETELHEDTIDYFHLLKVGEKWWIVSKVWDVEPVSK